MKKYKHKRFTARMIANENWSKNIATVTLQHCGGKVGRKVSTKGIRRFSFSILPEIEEQLRQGYEVRLTDAKGADVLRFFPCLKMDYKTIHVVAQSMGEFRNEPFTKTNISFVRNGEICTDKEVKKVIDEVEQVTPDIMAKCPTCGTRFRVGRKINK